MIKRWVLAAVVFGTTFSTTTLAAEGPAPRAKTALARAKALKVRTLRVGIAVGDVKDASAGDNDKVYVKINGGRPFYLNHGLIDFQRDDTRTYDLPVGPFDSIEDLESITLGKLGSNGVCVRAIRVRVDDIQIAFRDFTKEKNVGGNPCHWLDNEKGYKRDLTLKLSPESEGASLLKKVEANEAIERGERDWTITKEDFQLRLMSAIGHGLRVRNNGKIRWGYGGGSSKYVQADRASGNRDFNIDLDLKFAGTTKELDVDLGAQLCKHNSIVAMQVTNVAVKETSGWKAFTGNLVASLMDKIGESVGDTLALFGVPKAYGDKLGEQIEGYTRDYLIDAPLRAQKRAGRGIQLSNINEMFPAEMCAAGAKHYVDGDGNITVRFK